MLYNALSTLGMSRSLQSTMTRQQMELTRANEEVSTGAHADVAATIGAGTGRDIALRNLFDRTDLLAAASTGLGQQSPTGTSLQIRARGVLDQVVGLLNASSGNSYLFAGTALDQPPMRNVDGDKSGLRSPMQIVRDAIQSATGGTAMPTTAAETAAVVARLDDLFAVRDPATPAPAPLTDSFEGGLYTGTTALQPGGTASPRVSGQPAESTGIAYGVQANDPMMRQMLEGIYMLAAVDTSQMDVDAYPDYIRTAVDKLSGGLGKLREATAQLGIQRAQVATLAEQHKTQKSILSLQIDNLEGVDPYEASTRISQLEAQIDATSSATARIAKLHLTNYL